MDIHRHAHTTQIHAKYKTLKEKNGIKWKGIQKITWIGELPFLQFSVSTEIIPSKSQFV